jgi:hypothetical protein
MSLYQIKASKLKKSIVTKTKNKPLALANHPMERHGNQLYSRS